KGTGRIPAALLTSTAGLQSKSSIGHSRSRSRTAGARVTFSAILYRTSSIFMQVGSQSCPNRMTTTRSSSERMAWSTCQPLCKCGSMYDIFRAARRTKMLLRYVWSSSTVPGSTSGPGRTPGCVNEGDFWTPRQGGAVARATKPVIRGLELPAPARPLWGGEGLGANQSRLRKEASVKTHEASLSGLSGDLPHRGARTLRVPVSRAPSSVRTETRLLGTSPCRFVLVFRQAMGDQDLPGILVSGLEGPHGICEDHIGDLQKHFNVITMQEFLESNTQLGPKIQAVYIWGGKPPVTHELLQSLPSLKIIASAGAGLDHLDLKLVASFGVKVANTPQAVSSPTADMAMALLLAAARRVVEGHRLAIAPDTETFSMNWMGQEVTGATLGIIGMGSIGYKIAQRAKAFEMKILYHNRKRRKLEEEEAVGATFCESLDDLLQRSDFVLLAVSLTPQTQRLIGKRELSLMKSTAVLVNIGRGLLVDQDALVQALQTGVIKGAALDVTHPEPLPRDHPLLTLKNITLTPHVGSATHQARRQMMENLVESILASLHGLPIPNEVRLKRDNSVG
ncbi:GRHPR reductase, partial [Crocuta crocuta]